MSHTKKLLIRLIEDMPEKEIVEVIGFIDYLRIKRNNKVTEDIEKASESSLSFWDNPIDDEVWNDV